MIEIGGSGVLMYDELRSAWAALTSAGAQFEIVEVEVRGQRLREYTNAPPTLRDLWLASAAHSEKPYLVYRDERWSFADAHRQVSSVARWLFEQGVEPGDRVAIAMRNYPEWMLAYWACTSVGVAAIGMNAWWTAPELAYGIEDSDPKVIIADTERLERLSEVESVLSGRKLVGVRPSDHAQETRPGIVPWSDISNSSASLPEVTIDRDADACIFYTSGTTGRPKGAQLTHRGCVNNVMSMAFAATVQAMASAAARPKPEAVDRPNASPAALVTTPLFHVTANNCLAQSMTLAGGKLVHMYKWDAGEALRLIEVEKITSMSGVPTMARELIAHPDFEKRDTSSLATLGGGGAQLQPDLVEKIDRTVASARPSTGYGMTETCGIITAIASDFFVDRPDSAGRAMPSYEVKTVDASGDALDANQVGELWVRGAQVIKGYLNRPDATAETITDGWLHTGDIARIDDDGFIYIVDRAKDMLLRGGENIYCAEVEAALFEHGAVAECAVFGVPDDRLGEEVGAAIVLKPAIGSFDVDELRGFLAQRLAKFKVPRYVWVQDEALPRNASGKFLKRELREQLDVADAV
jgi:long-chain acyl-CoA synthetase